MKKNITIADYLFLISAFISLIFSEILWFNGEEKAGIFIGLWVPSILCFAVYFKLLKTPVK